MQPTTTSSLDQDAVNLTKAIRQSESGGNFTAKGKSGEYGAYQYTDPTWAKDSAAAGVSVPLKNATKEQQNEVAYKTVKAMKDKGLNVGQIASSWNAGVGEPDAYMGKFSNGKPSVGVNGYGAHFDVPAYAKSVADAYQSIKKGGQPGVDPNNPSNTAPPQTNSYAPPGATAQNGGGANGYAAPVAPPPPSLSSDTASADSGNPIINGAKAVGNFLFPAVGDIYHDIKGDSTKTVLQQLGDVGSTALGVATLIPGIGEGALAAKAGLMGVEGATEGANLASRAAPGLMQAVGKNAALGTGFGVSGALGEGKTDVGDIAKSGFVGGITGGALGAGGKYASDVLAKKAGTTAESRLMDQTTRLKTLGKSFADNSRPATKLSSATNPIQTLEQNGLTKGLKVAGGKVDASALTNPENTGTIDNLIEGHSTDATKLVASLKGSVPITEMEKEIMDAVAKNPAIRDVGGVSKAQAEVKRIFADYKNSFGDNLPYNVVDNIRIGMNRVYDPAERDVARTIGDSARDYLYNGDEANTALRSAMQNESELIRAKNFVEKLHGTTVPGGQLGKYFADMVGAAAGGAAGSFFGPFGEAAGFGIGGLVTHKVGNAIQGSYFNPIGAGLVRRMAGSTPASIIKNVAKVSAFRGLSSQNKQQTQ